MNFNAEELKNTSNHIYLYFLGSDASIGVKLSWIRHACENASDIVKSEDSNLANTCTNLATTFDQLENKFIEIGNSLQENFNNYINETLVNESGATQSLDEINGNLESINSALSSL